MSQKRLSHFLLNPTILYEIALDENKELFIVILKENVFLEKFKMVLIYEYKYFDY